MTIPEFLYHYTTVESLAMILSTQSIRFSPLGKLDDRYEESTKEMFNPGRFIFISSWMGSEEESIPMWNQYSQMESGVRIKLPSLPFEQYQVSNQEGGNFQSVIPDKETYNSPWFLVNRRLESSLIKVEYTNDEEKINPRLVFPKERSDEDSTNMVINFGILGRYKKMCWSYQEEWRFRLMFIPVGYREMSRNQDIIGQIFWDRLHDLNYRLPFDYYFLKLSEEALTEMEVTLSPKITEGNRVIVESLRDKYNPKMKIHNSNLQHDIR